MLRLGRCQRCVLWQLCGVMRVLDDLEVLASLVKAGKSGKLGTNELLAVLLCRARAPRTTSPRFEDPWTPENRALLTSEQAPAPRHQKRRPAGEDTGKFRDAKAKGIVGGGDGARPPPCARPGLRCWGRGG